MGRTITLSPSCKLCRREGEKLFLKGERCHTPKCAITRRSYIPGVHGTKRQKRLSQYGQQLRAKQKAKRLYGVMEKKFYDYYQNAVKHEDSGLYLQQQLESRLDNVVYRLGLGVSRAQSRQAIVHGHILVNDKKLDIPSYQVKSGDTITVSKKALEQAKLFKDVKERSAQANLPSWLVTDGLVGKVVSRPLPEDVKGTIKAKQIIEFYSRF